ncbi:MAG TPA: BON domain-containing protein [Gemmatimonadaceae bacterium]|nr:BON domain-containing protein [Gemmatimonadaceae bacterium]
MRRIRYRDETPSIGGIVASITAGALAGFAVGVVAAQKMGGLSGIAARISRRFPDFDDGSDLHHGYGEDDLADAEVDGATLLEEQVLAAFEEDPVLSERAIDIASVGTGVIELSGWVRNEAESRRAETVARRVTGVDAVVNRLSSEEDVDTQPPDRDVEIGDEETDEPLPGGQWQGQRVGTGRRRQGSSSQADRHSDPKPHLESRWLDKQHAIEEAAGDIEGVAERRTRGKKGAAKGDRTGGAPESPSGVPKADHVVNPEAAPPTQSVERPEGGPG